METIYVAFAVKKKKTNTHPNAFETMNIQSFECLDALAETQTLKIGFK